PSSGCFSPFPHGTGALSVTEEYLGLEGGPPMFRQDCTCPALLEDMDPGFPYGAVTRCGPPFQALPVPKTHATGLFRVRSPLLALDPRRFRKEAPHNTAAHRGKTPTPKRPHMKTLLAYTQALRLEPIRLGHMTNSLFTPSTNTPARVGPDGIS